jgi:transcriptional regulator with XRE-family HTH domain
MADMASRSARIGKRIKHLREERALTIRELAERSEVSRTHLSELERGLIPSPGLDNLERLAAALGTTLVGLLEGTDPEESESPPEAIATSTHDGGELTDRELRLAHQVARIVIDQLKRERLERLSGEQERG